jgi:multiple sugar transport system permease protein
MRTSRSYIPYLLVSPWLITFAVFWAYPFAYSFYLSLTKYKTLTSETIWIGTANYVRLFSDPAFIQALLNTVIFVVGTIPLTMFFALLFAALLERVTILQNLYRSALFLPTVTSLVVIALVFSNLYSADGYLHTLLSMAGIPTPEKGFLLEPSTALFSIMAMDTWVSIGYYTVLFLAAMQNIPRDYYEAASLEGASVWKQFRSITLPLIKPTLLFAIVLNTIKSFQVFTEIYVMTRGGPLGSTTTLVYSLYDNAFEKADGMGYASAIAYVLFFIIAIFAAVEFRMLKRS